VELKPCAVPLLDASWLSRPSALSRLDRCPIHWRRPAAEPTTVPQTAIDVPLAAGKSQQTAVLAGGCFWGVQAVFEHLKGVRSVAAGYSGGRINSPNYEMVSSGLTGHAESVSITFDPRKSRMARS